MKARAIVLLRRPEGRPVAEDFEERELLLPQIRAGELLVRNVWMSLDPYLRLVVSTASPLSWKPLPLGSPLVGAAVGTVVESRAESLPAGTWVISQKHGWRDVYVARAEALERIDTSLGPPQQHLGILGLSGITALAGVGDILMPCPGERVFVSSAAGAVGMIALQLARLRGARVIGSAGSDEKGEWLRSRLGLDAFVNYRRGRLAEELAAWAPDGLDGYFDNVGGGHLEAAIERLKPGGRIALCGAIARYNETNFRRGPDNFFRVIEQGLALKGFHAGLYRHRRQELTTELARLYGNGELLWQETITEGLENAVQAWFAMLSGEIVGKALVRLPAARAAR